MIYYLINSLLLLSLSLSLPSTSDVASLNWSTLASTVLGDELLLNIDTINSNISLQVQHARLGHYGQHENCEICIIAKGQRTKTGTINTRKVATSPYERLHMDLIGPISTVTTTGNRIPVPTFGNKRYALIIVDELTSFVHIYLLKQKSDAKTEIMNLINLIKRQHNITVKGIHSDRGGEFLNGILESYYASQGIIHTTSPANRQHLNGKAEAINKAVVNTARSMLVESGAPVQLWGDALLTAGFIRNRTSFKSLGDISPYELIYKTKPNLTRLRVWGADAFVYVEKSQRGKFDPIKMSGMFLGYSDQQYAYRILLSNENIIITRDVTILEESFKHMNEYALMYPGDSTDTTYGLIPSPSTINFHTLTINGRDIDDETYKVQSNSPLLNQSQRNPKQSHTLDTSLGNGVPSIKVPEIIILDDNSNEIGEQHSNVPIDSDVSDTDQSINDSGIVSWNEYDLDLPEEQCSSSPSHSDESDEIPVHNNTTDDEYYENKTSTIADENSDDSEYESKLNSNPNDYFITAEQLQPVVTSSTSSSSSTTSSTRVSRYPPHAPGFYNQKKSIYGNYDPTDRKQLATISSISEEVLTPSTLPETIYQFEDLSMKSYKQMMYRKDAILWDTATSMEFNSLIEQNVGTEIDPTTLPIGTPIVPCRFVYAEKHNDLNEVVTRKARMVLRGDLQKDGSYNETFAPTGKSTSIKLIISHTVQCNNELKQYDVSHAFLYATVDEDIYIKLPEGCGSSTGKIWKLNKALYGLKQAPHAWNKEMNGTLISLGYKPIYSDPCVYIKHIKNEIIILYLYVDDTIVSYNKSIENYWIKDYDIIKSKYKIKDLGNCEWILNMKLVRDRVTGTITLSQEAYIKQILINSHMDINTTKSVDNPGDPSLYIQSTTDDTQSDFTPLTPTQHAYYRKVLGELLYAALMTRLDIAHSVSFLSRFAATPTTQHLNAIKRILRYLVGTSHYAMIFNATSTPLSLPDQSIVSTDYPIIAFSDASWGNDLETSKSTTGALLKFLGNVICWVSKKQDCVAVSSTESEYYALSHTISEALWVQHWVEEVFDITTPILTLCDNQSALHLSSHDSIHRRSKHIRIRYHFIRDYINKGYIIVTWVQTAKQEADLLTKCLNTKTFISLVSQNLLTD